MIVIVANCASPAIAWWQLALITLTVPSLFSATKTNRIDRVIGEMSFPMYMFHFPVLSICRSYHIGEGNIGLGNAAAIGSLFCGIVVFWLIDRPIDRWRHGRSDASATKAAEKSLKRDQLLPTAT